MPRKENYKGIYKAMNRQGGKIHAAGMPWKPKKQYVFKRVSQPVTEKFDHIRIKRPPDGNYVIGGLSESKVIADATPTTEE